MELDSIEVTATRIPTLIKESGKSVSVITHEDIEAMPVTSVDELLQSLPGVNLNSRNAFGVQADIGMRGSTFAQVLVLVDGIRINDPLTAHFNNNIPVSMSEIERIEIIRGPAATSFGADAVGGIIHIKTRTFMNRSDTNRGFSSSGNIGYGEESLLLTDAGFHVQLDKLQISGGLKTSISDGQTFQNPNFGQVESADQTYRNHFNLQTYTLSAAYQFSDKWRLYSRIGYDERDFSAKYFYTGSTFDESYEETESVWTQLALSRTGEMHQTDLNMGYRNGSDYFLFNPALPANEHTSGQYTFSLNHGINLDNDLRLSVGTQGFHKTIESTDRGNHENSSIGFYTILSKQLTENLKGTASARIEYDENFGTEFLPQVSLAYPLENVSFRSSFGKAIRAGDFTERFVSTQIENLSPGRNLGNADLEAETSYTIDFGVDIYPSDGLTISNTAFYRTSENLIDYTVTNSNSISNSDNLQPDAEYYYATNVSDSRTFGVESLIGKYFALANSRFLHAEVNYTYLFTTNDAGDVSKYIANHPKHDLSFIFSYQGEYFEVTSTSHLIKRNSESLSAINGRIQSDYFLSHLKVEAMPFSKNRLSFYMKVHNLLDTDYQEILGAQMPGRWVMAGIQWNL
jgi:iron complex outermembrane receptor protein